MRRWAQALLIAIAAAASAAAAPLRVLTLGEALRLSRERQPQLRQIRAATQAAAARADEARSGLLPQVSLSAAYPGRTTTLIDRPGPSLAATGTDSFKSFSSGLAVSQLLWDFGQVSGRYRASQAQAEAAQQNEKATALQTGLAVATTYFDARANKALVAVAQENLDNQRRHLEQIQAFVQSGVRPDIDLFQARTDAANAQVLLINADNAYGVSRAQLNQAIGLEGATDFDVADESLPEIKGEAGDPEALFAEALKARPEVASLEDQFRAQVLTLRGIDGAYGPSISAVAGVNQAGTFDRPTWNASAGLNLSWQLYQGGLTGAQSREAEANAAQIRAQLDVVRLQLRLELEQARLAIKAAKGSLSAAGEALHNARERLKLAEGRYQTGIGSIIELGDAQVALTTAAAQAVQADYRVATARAQLLKALGRP